MQVKSLQNHDRSQRLDHNEAPHWMCAGTSKLHPQTLNTVATFEGLPTQSSIKPVFDEGLLSVSRLSVFISKIKMINF